jgi:hypothetical protein
MAKHRSERLNRLEGKQVTRKPTNLYLDVDLYKEFKLVIGDLAASEVMEDYMRDEVAISKGELQIDRIDLTKKKKS